jgi:hypothetical protein
MQGLAATQARAVNLKVPIAITDELTEEVIHARGQLDLASGEIDRVEYDDAEAVAKDGLPWESDDYEFSSGVLSHNGRDVEFRVDVNKVTGQYSVSASELLEIKVRAAALFAGVTGPALLAQAQTESTESRRAPVVPASPGAPTPPAAPAAAAPRRGGRPPGRFH